MTQSLPPKRLVLYADDDPDDRELVLEAFSAYAQNIQLRTFSDGIELLRFVATPMPFRPVPCLVILDINMPRLSGKETLIRLRRIEGYDQVPVVLFTTSTLPLDASFAKHYGAGFVTKPLLSRQVEAVLDQLIEHCADDVKKHIRRQGNR